MSQPEATIAERIAAATQEAPPPEAQAVLEKAEEVPEEAVDGAAIQAEADDSSDIMEDSGEGSTDGSASEEDVDTVEVSSLSDLMEHFEVDPEDLYNLTIPVTSGSSSVDVSLSEMKDSFVARTEATRLREEAKTLRDSLQQKQAEADTQIQEYLAQSGALVHQLETQMLAQFDDTSLKALREENPSEWAAVMQEKQAAEAAINQVKAKVRDDIANFKTRQSAEQQEALKVHLAAEQEALVKLWPEMGDPEKAESERKSLIGELKARGYNDQEIGQAYDHRILLMARDAMRWRESQKKVATAKKKVVKIGKKTLRPGAKPTRGEQLQDRTQGLRKNLRKSGRVDDAAALISALEQG